MNSETNQGLMISAIGALIAVVSLLLLVTWDALAIVGLLLGGAIIVVGYLWTMHFRGRQERF